MTSALLVRRRGHTFEIIEGPIQIGAAITKWKAAVNADVAAPASEGVTHPDAIEVLALQTVRSHKLRSGYPIPTEPTPAAVDASQDAADGTGESAPPPDTGEADQAGGSGTGEESPVTEPPTASELPPAEPVVTDAPPPALGAADPPRGRRKG